MLFWNSIAISKIHWMSTIWSLVSLWNPACISANTLCMHCWSPAWRILTVTLITWEKGATIQYFEHSLVFPFVQFSSFAQSSLTLCDPMNRTTPGLPVHHQLPEFTQTHVHWVGDVTQPSDPLSSSYPPAFNLSKHQVFSNESAFHIRWSKYWSFSFNISPSNEHSGLISFRMDWLDLLAVQGTVKSLLQHHSSKAAILQPSALFIVQLSHPYMTTGKTISLTRQTSVGKVTSLLFFF